MDDLSKINIRGLGRRHEITVAHQKARQRMWTTDLRNAAVKGKKQVVSGRNTGARRVLFLPLSLSF